MLNSYKPSLYFLADWQDARHCSVKYQQVFLWRRVSCTNLSVVPSSSEIQLACVAMFQGGDPFHLHMLTA